MEPFNVVIIDAGGTAKDPHPLGECPFKDKDNDFLDKKNIYPGLSYEEAVAKWKEIDATLKTYLIESLRCDSGIIVSNKVLHWHVGKTYKALDNLEDDFIQIV